MTDTTAKTPAAPAAEGDDHADLKQRIESLKAQADALKAKVDAARNWVEDRTEKAKGWAGVQRTHAKELVQEDPLMAAGVSAGVALLIGIGIGFVLSKVLDE